jgi:hypothetical protein
MSENDVKKVLYKEKPIAIWQHTITGSDMAIKNYKAISSLGTHLFSVPFSDMGETQFEDEIPSQLFIRWLITETK